MIAAITEDVAYRNACGHSDRENAVLEGNAAVRRAILGSGDMELIRLFVDVPEFRQRLHREVIEKPTPNYMSFCDHSLRMILTMPFVHGTVIFRANTRGCPLHEGSCGRKGYRSMDLSHAYGGGDNKSLFVVEPEARRKWSCRGRRYSVALLS